MSWFCCAETGRILSRPPTVDEYRRALATAPVLTPEQAEAYARAIRRAWREAIARGSL